MKKTNYLRKGSGEFIAFAILAPLICSLVVVMVAYVQFSISLHELTKALSVASRSAVICKSLEDAESQGILVAQSSIDSSNMSNIYVDIEFIGSNTEWKKGELVSVTIYADIETITPYIISGTRKKQMIMCIENDNS